jgi:signal transduction histidine kinase/AmiR/NasT family two-component response regulator
MMPRLHRKAGLAALVALCLSTLLAAGLVAMAQMRQAYAVDAGKLGWKDSTVSLVFGFERQLMRFRGDLQAALAVPGEQPGPQPLALSYEILVSRILLLRESSSLAMQHNVPEHATLIRQLDVLVDLGDRALGAGATRADLVALADQIERIIPDAQSYTLATARMSSSLIEQQFDTVREQAAAIGLLAVLHLVLLGLTGYVLWSREQEQRAARRQLEQLADELREANIAAEAASRSKSRFLANMSHELRTPFQGVLGMLQLLGQTPATPAQRDLIATAQESARHLLALLNDVLDVSAVEAGKLTLHPAPLDLPQLCREACDQMGAQARARGLALHLRTADGLPQWVLGDATRVKQVLFNLLGNAIKFTPQGEVALDVRAARSVGGLWWLCFRVSDTGIGMDPATLARLFRRFEVGDSAQSRRFGGTGLGLEISRSLARMMRGDISVSSAPGRGSVFELTVLLPGCVAPAPAEEAAAPAAAPAPAVPKHVLVADDHPINRKYLSLLLRSLGHAVSVAEDGQQALDAVRRTAFDAVLLDVHMPVLDGVDTARAIRALPVPHAGLPIVMLTADVLEETRESALAAGADAVLAKPLRTEQLAAVLGAADLRAAGARPLSAQFGELAGAFSGAEIDRLVGMFFDDGSGTIADLDDALAAGDAARCAAAAHKLKGAAALLGFSEVVRVTQEIGAAAQDGRPFPAAELGLQLQWALAATRNALAARRTDSEDVAAA